MSDIKYLTMSNFPVIVAYINGNAVLTKKKIIKISTNLTSISLCETKYLATL